MSGPFGSQQWMFSTASEENASCDGGPLPTYTHKIEQSCRFASTRSTYLSRTPSATGNRKTWTWSGWIKRGNLGSIQNLFSSDTGNIMSMHRLRIYNDESSTRRSELFEFFSYDGTTEYKIQTIATFRDVSAWYHVVAVYDTSNATSTDRMRLYVNGNRITEFGTVNYPPLNYDGMLNDSIAHNIGRWVTVGHPDEYFDGYMAEVNFVDGQALDPEAFGEWSEGTWVPKKYEGDRGTNGFYLDFVDGGNLGKDAAGSNDWASNNLAVTDQVLDTPTNNFCTFNPIAGPSYLATLSEGNLRAYYGGAYSSTVPTLLTPPNGKWYSEMLIVDRGGDMGIAVHDFAQNPVFSIGWVYNGNTYGNTGGTPMGTGFTNGDIIGFACDGENNQLQFYKNGVAVGPLWQFPTENPSEFQTHQGYMYGGTDKIANFGQDSSFSGQKTAQGHTDANGIGDFYYPPPAGYLALCTANMPEPQVAAQDHFNPVIYTGTGGVQSVTGVGFQPDFVWVKRRDSGVQTDSNYLHDVVRGDAVVSGVMTPMASNGPDPESTWDQTWVNNYGKLSSFDPDGFTVGPSPGVSGYFPYNGNGNTYVSWNWKAGGAGVPNNDGTIPSVVSANPCAGFSVVSYTGTGANATFGHGLNSAPAMVIIKGRSTTYDWVVFHKNLTNASHYIVLNKTDQSFSAPTVWNSTAPTATTVSLGNNLAVNSSSVSHVAYCFAEVEGYSKFGSYTGNGSADGPFVYCGFRPAFVMWKLTSAAGLNWGMQDNRRLGYNPDNAPLFADLNAAEYTPDARPIDILSNGYKIRRATSSQNLSGGHYIFMAFAEQPFKYANAR